MSSSGARSVFTLVPRHRPVELVAYYPEFVDYYLECELQTKRWFVENMRRDWSVSMLVQSGIRHVGCRTRLHLKSPPLLRGISDRPMWALLRWRYRAAGFADRVHQILCDSRELDTTGFFDSVLIDGGHTAEVVTSVPTRRYLFSGPVGL